jgi:hypothetical protein
MIYVFCGVFFILGVVVGFRYCAWVNGNVFQAMFDNGVMVLRTDDGWDGTDEAWKSIAMKVRK